MAISIALLASYGNLEGSSRTFNVTLGGSGTNNAIIIYVPSHYSVYANVTATIGGVAATKFFSQYSGSNSACHAILGRSGLSPATYSVYVSPNEFHVWRCLVYAIYETTGWNSTIESYLNQVSGTTKTVYPSVQSGQLFVEHTRFLATTSAVIPTPYSSQTRLGGQIVDNGTFYDNDNIHYKANIGSSPSLAFYYSNNYNNYNLYAGVEYLPVPTGGGSVIWWFKQLLEKRRKKLCLYPSLLPI